MGDGCKVFVGNVSYECGNDELYDHFGQYGKIEDAVVITDRDTGRSRGFGFVTFQSPDEAQAAIKGSNGMDLRGRDLTVREAENKRGGGGGGGGYGGGRRDNFNGGGGRYGGGGGGGYRNEGRGYSDEGYRGGGGGGGGYRGGNDYRSGGGGGGGYNNRGGGDRY